MKVIASITNPDSIEVSITITCNLETLKKIRQNAIDGNYGHYPLATLLRGIQQVISDSEKQCSMTDEKVAE